MEFFMSLSYRKMILWTAALCVSVFSATPAPKGPVFPLFSHSIKSHGAALLHHGLAKTAANLVYAKTGATNYSNAGTVSAPVWPLSSRDTIIYDGLGNEILFMSSRTQNGWNQDSLSEMDSTVYLNGKVVETVNLIYSGPGTIIDGFRSSIAYLNSDKATITTKSVWNDSTHIWTFYEKDSAVYSDAAGANSSGISDLTNLISLFSWSYDTSKKAWLSAGSLTKMNAECTATTLVLSEKSQSTITDSSIDIIMTITFSSPVWNENNITQFVLQQKDPVTGNFVNVSKHTNDANANGSQLDYENFNWDTLQSAWVPSSKSLDFPDAHGNDTLELSADYYTTTSVWDTSSMDRYVRTYDANGNNTVILSSTYYSFEGTWNLSSKTLNTFALINSSVKTPPTQSALQNILVKATPATVTFSGRDLEGLDLYNAAGRFVLSVRQKPAAVLSLNLANATVPAGVYVARVIAGSGKSTVRLGVCR
jgi:hypothetical protein